MDFEEVNQTTTVTTSPYTFSVMILEDGVVENDETFSLSLTSDDEGVNITTNTTVITIIDTSECTVYSTYEV